MKSIILLFFLLSTGILYADSFLTTTPFSEAYEDVRIIKKAGNAGEFNKKLLKYLFNQKKPIALKLALINKIGWKIDGQNNLQQVVDYAVKKGKYESYDDLVNKADASLLACIAYIKALDDYRDVSEAEYLAYKALRKDKSNSTSIHLVHTLIKAQEHQIKDRWCRAYEVCDELKMNKNLNQDMASEALKIVFDYADGYSSYC